MNVLEWATDPRGHSVPIHIAWFLIQVAFFSAVAFLIVHAAYVRFFAGEKQFSGTAAPEVVAAIPERVPRHSRVACRRAAIASTPARTGSISWPDSPRP